VQGLGAAFMIPTSLALIGAAFDGEARGRAVGTWAAAGSITSALGPLAGGWLIDVTGWRPIFLINLPIALAAASSPGAASRRAATAARSGSMRSAPCSPPRAWQR
jgi:MFS family permease